jgi:M6 family metalloprotease-like protein
MGPFPSIDPGPEQRAADILRRVSNDGLVQLTTFDANGDGYVTADELCVLVVENIALLSPANRTSNPITVTEGTNTKIVTTNVAFAGPSTPFYQIAHELMHSLGAVDMYNYGSGNYDTTLMSGYSFYSDDQHTVHLDPIHKLKLGWIEPAVYRTSTAESASVPSFSSGSVALFWDVARGPREYFIMERRSPVSYDANVADDGIFIWHNRPSGTFGSRSAPSLNFGQNSAWKDGMTTPALTWEDGSSTGATFTMHVNSTPDSDYVQWR